MQGFPSEGDAQVTLENWRTPPHNRWAFQHVSELVPSAQIWRGSGRARELRRAPEDLSAISFDDHTGANTTFGAFLDSTSTDGLCVLRRGAIIPEVKGSAFAGCTLQHMLDMTVGVDFTEDYLAAEGPITEYREVSGWKPPSDPDRPGDLRSWLTTLRAQGSHGHAFHYVSPTTNVLGWVIERVTTRTFAEAVSELLWQPMGAEFDGYVTVDRFGAPRAGGGVCLALRDLARVGLMMLENAWRTVVRSSPSPG